MMDFRSSRYGALPVGGVSGRKDVLRSASRCSAKAPSAPGRGRPNECPPAAAALGLEPLECPVAFAVFVFAFVFDAFFDFAFAMKTPPLKNARIAYLSCPPTRVNAPALFNKGLNGSQIKL